MRVYHISKCNYIDDLTGTGASLYPGRWHSKGTFVLYTAASPSLAMLESVVHITTLVRPELCMICLDIPESGIKELPREQLPEEWFAHPPINELKEYGDRFVRDGIFVALKVPSAVMPEESNYLLNPAHPEFRKVKRIYIRNLRVDERLLKR